MALTHEGQPLFWEVSFNSPTNTNTSNDINTNIKLFDIDFFCDGLLFLAKYNFAKEIINGGEVILENN